MSANHLAWRFPQVEQIGADQVSAIATATPVALFGAALNTLIVAVSFAGSLGPLELAVWCIASWSLAGYFTYRSKRKRTRLFGAVTTRTIRRAVLIAALWALPRATLVTTHIGSLPHKHELILVALCAGMAAS